MLCSLDVLPGMGFEFQWAFARWTQRSRRPSSSTTSSAVRGGEDICSLRSFLCDENAAAPPLLLLLLYIRCGVLFQARKALIDLTPCAVRCTSLQRGAGGPPLPGPGETRLCASCHPGHTSGASRPRGGAKGSGRLLTGTAGRRLDRRQNGGERV